MKNKLLEGVRAPCINYSSCKFEKLNHLPPKISSYSPVVLLVHLSKECVQVNGHLFRIQRSDFGRRSTEPSKKIKEATTECFKKEILFDEHRSI